MSGKKNAADWQKLNEIFAEAINLATVEREVFLNRSCEGDENLRREVEAILSANSRAGEQNFLQTDVFTAGVRALAQSENGGVDLSGKLIGNYKIIREIGRGGMGAVYLAEREDFKRQVALKIIKRGMDTDDIIRRFERERQVLASLNHPNIAHLLDGGTTDDGLPFFVMECVEGLPITEYCDRQKLNIEERLELFRKVCAAVAYAHQNLIVHRDIKPSNILVDNLGEPKLLDFGISKLLADEAAENTGTAVRLMTPEYASPEQIRGERVTTVSDIYSLGVLLYELLSGHRPFKLKNRLSAEILKIVSEEEPPAPSTAALTAEEILRSDTKEILSPATIAESRAEKPERLRRKLAGDLDNIVLMSLRKEPSRRYRTVEQFSEDLRRHLSGLPVVARPATFGYHVSKFVQRNRVQVVFSSIALLAVLAGFSIAVWQAVVARQERARAEKKFNEVRKLANNLISNWDKGIPPEAVHFQVRGRLADLSAEYLDALAQEADDPALLKELAEAHLKLGQEYGYQFINLEKAEASFRRTETIARQLIASAPDDLGAKDLLAQSLEKHNEFFGERAPEASLQNHLQIVRLREEILAANPDDEQALRRAGQSNDWCGLAYKKLGRREEAVYFARRAEEYYERRVEVLDRSANTPEDRAKLASTLIRLAFHRAEHLNEIERAVANSRRGFEIAQSVYAEKPDNDFIVTAGYEYGMILKKAGEHRRAIEALRVSVETARIFFARGVSAYIKGREFRSLLEIAESLNELGETQAAVETAKEALEVRRKWMGLANNHLSGEQNWRHGLFFLGGGKLLARMGKFDEAEGVFSESEQSLLKVLKDSPDKLINRQTLAVLYMTMGDFYGGLGVCSFEKMKSIGTITNGVDAAYCSPDSNKFTTNHPRLQKARSFYQKAVNFLTELEAANAATPPDREILRIGREKIATSSERLQGKS